MDKRSDKKQALFSVEQAFNAARRDKNSPWVDVIGEAESEKPDPEKQRTKNN